MKKWLEENLTGLDNRVWEKHSEHLMAILNDESLDWISFFHNMKYMQACLDLTDALVSHFTEE